MKQELWPGQRVRILTGHPDPDYVGLKGITRGRAGAIREERDVKEKGIRSVTDWLYYVDVINPPTSKTTMIKCQGNDLERI